MKKLFLYVIGSLIILPVYSQHLIKGTIIDSENAVMPMVNVAFLNQADSTLVTGAVSDSCGVYGTSLAGGNYIIRYSYLGYETLYRNIQVNANLTLPVVKMELAQTELEGVEVTAYRKPFKLDREGITADVPNTILAKQTTLDDLLCKIPGIQKRGEDIEVIGRGLPTYYINGREVTDRTELDNLAIDQIQSVRLVMTRMLMKEEGALHLDLHHLGFHMGALKQILLIGLPAGLQSTVFSLSNVVIQSAINSFGSTVVAGSSASANLEGFVYTAMNAFSQAAVTFTSQNMGARKYQNLNRVVLNCLLCAIVTGVVLGGGAVLAGDQLLHFYSSDAAVIAAGYERLRVICGTYLLCGIMDTLASSLRGLGYSVLPMVVSLVGSCLLRLVWIATIFQLNRTPFMLYISYPISWVLTAAVHLACLLVVRHKMKNKLKLSID